MDLLCVFSGHIHGTEQPVVFWAFFFFPPFLIMGLKILLLLPLFLGKIVGEVEVEKKVMLNVVTEALSFLNLFYSVT